MKTKVCGFRLTSAERQALRKIGGGSLTSAIREAIELLFQRHQVKIEN